MDITDPHVVRTAFLNTYADRDEPHPLRRFEQYELVQRCREETGAGPATISEYIDIPEGRIHGWIYRDSAPTGYEAMQTAESLGLFSLDWDSEQFQGLNELVAWVYSGGTVNHKYTPVFSVEDDTEAVCEAAIERAGVVEYTAESGQESRVLRITDPQAVFGRFLVALGAPQGQKGEEQQQYGLPCYLGDAPELVRQRFAAIYLLNRAVEQPDRPGFILREERPPAYLKALAGLLRSVSSAEISVGSDYRLYIDQAVLSELSVPKKWNSEVS